MRFAFRIIPFQSAVILCYICMGEQLSEAVPRCDVFRRIVEIVESR